MAANVDTLHLLRDIPTTSRHNPQFDYELVDMRSLDVGDEERLVTLQYRSAVSVSESGAEAKAPLSSVRQVATKCDP